MTLNTFTLLAPNDKIDFTPSKNMRFANRDTLHVKANKHLGTLFM